jgi:hypothetical protein
MVKKNARFRGHVIGRPFLMPKDPQMTFAPGRDRPWPDQSPRANVPQDVAIHPLHGLFESSIAADGWLVAAIVYLGHLQRIASRAQALSPCEDSCRDRTG